MGLPRVAVMAPHTSALVRGLQTLALALLLVGGAMLGGLLATTVAPAHASTTYYAADVSLSPFPSDRASISTSTVVGDLRVRFEGLAPGLVVDPRVKAEITEAITTTRLDVESLTPGERERQAAVTEAAKGVALRFAIGGLVVVGLVLAGSSLWQRRLPSSQLVAAGLAAWLGTSALTGWSVRQTYQADRLGAFESSGLLKLAVDNKDLLADVETRATQATPYLRNLLALSTALRQQYAPADIDAPAATRVLLVSDIHSANQYALMRTIVEEQDIDVVVDSGDLINLGVVEEARLTGLTDGIASLGVPYVFVRGNHDASGPGTGALLEELAGVQNVVLLQPADDEYVEVEVGGLRIAGFNDPRWYGDDDPDPESSQRPAREAYLAASEGRETPDLVVSHQEAALDGVPGRLRVHGHGHVPRVDGNRVQVGTFTGGGTLKHFLTGPDAEPVGQPSSFDVLTVGAGCEVLSLTRYQYRAVLEGRPSYDSVSIINGARVAGPPDEGRTCGGDEVTTTPFAAPASDS